MAAAAALVACNPNADEARALAKDTCDTVQNAPSDPAQEMLEAFHAAEAAGVSESQFRQALIAECGMEPPPVPALENFGDS